MVFVLAIESYFVRNSHEENLSDFSLYPNEVSVFSVWEWVTVVPLFADVKNTLDSISSNIKDMSQSIPIEDMLLQVSHYLNNSNRYLNQELPKLEEYDSYWWVCPWSWQKRGMQSLLCMGLKHDIIPQ
jgi:hypothetical protein